MRELVVLSGKGGTGKTTVAAAFAHLAAQETSVVLADADVDASNLELVVGADLQERHEFRGGKLATVDPTLCSACGRCAEVCRFDAIVQGEVFPREVDPVPPPREVYAVDPVLCEGCAVCFYQCPEQAIRLEEALDGHWFISESRFGPLIHGALRAGRENSGKLVSLVKEQARRLAKEQESKLLLVDGPPGIGCPVIASLSGAQVVLVVTEPTVAGFHDLARIVGVAQHFQIPVQVCLNKADLSPAQSREVERFCQEEGIELIGRIPFDATVTQAMVRGLPVTAADDGPAAGAIREMWRRLHVPRAGE
jgi:MinD superfamily P-loop ATPase